MLSLKGEKGQGEIAGEELICFPSPGNSWPLCEGRIGQSALVKMEASSLVMAVWVLGEASQPGGIATKQQLALYSNPVVYLRLNLLGSCPSADKVSCLLLLLCVIFTHSEFFLLQTYIKSQQLNGITVTASLATANLYLFNLRKRVSN